MVHFGKIFVSAFIALAASFSASEAATAGCADIALAQIGLTPSVGSPHLVVTQNALLTTATVSGLNINVASAADGSAFTQFALQASQGILTATTTSAQATQCPNNPSAFAIQTPLVTAATNYKFTWQGALPVTFNALVVSGTTGAVSMLIACASTLEINDPTCITNIVAQNVNVAATTATTTTPPPKFTMNVLFGFATSGLIVLMVAIVIVSMFV